MAGLILKLHRRLGIANCAEPKNFSNTPSIAVCESRWYNASERTFVIFGLSKRDVESQCSQIEKKLKRTVDAMVVNVEKEFV